MQANFVIQAFQSDQLDAVIELWHACGLIESQNDPRQDITRKCKHSSAGFLVALSTDDNGQRPTKVTQQSHEDSIIGTVMAGYDGHRGWINYLAVAPDAQHQGIGAALMQAAESYLVDLGCAKINLQIRSINTDIRCFYEQLNYSQDDVISMGKRLSLNLA